MSWWRHVQSFARSDERFWTWVPLVLVLTVTVGVALFYPMHSYHGFNEGWYVAKASGQLEAQDLPNGYALLGSLIPLEPLVALRLLSLSGLVMVGVAAYLASGRGGVLLALSTPWMVVWSSHAQTDMLALGMMLLGLANRSPSALAQFLSGWVLGFSPYIKPPMALGILLAVHMHRKKPWFLVGLCVGLLPFLQWLFLQAPKFIEWHRRQGQPFGNAVEVVWLGLILGGGMSWAGLRTINRPHVWLAGLFLAFALIKAPIGHAYYTIPVVGIVSLFGKSYPYWVIPANCLISLFMLLWLL